MGRLYAEGTTVPVERTQQEIIATLRRYGADGFLFGEDQGYAVLAFTAHGRQVRFVLPLEVDIEPLRYTKGRQRRSALQIETLVKAEVRRRYRALALAIKAKLEAVESGIVDFEAEFLAHIVLPNQQTVGEYVGPQLSESYDGGTMPALLPGARPALEA